MKKTVIWLLLAAMAFSLFGCALTEESTPSVALEVLEDAEKITVHLYREDEEKSLTLGVTEELSALVNGKWTETSLGREGGKKVLTLTVGTQHEITFFDNGKAMIYYGKVSVIEKDRRYYYVELDSDIDELYNYCLENGKVPNTEE